MVFLLAPVATLLEQDVAYNTNTDAAFAIAAEASFETLAWNIFETGLSSASNFSSSDAILICYINVNLTLRLSTFYYFVNF